jgi:hypothetical protein
MRTSQNVQRRLPKEREISWPENLTGNGTGVNGWTRRADANTQGASRPSVRRAQGADDLASLQTLDVGRWTVRQCATSAYNLAPSVEQTHLQSMLRVCDAALQIPPCELRCARPRGHTGLCRALGGNGVIYFGSPTGDGSGPRLNTPTQFRQRTLKPQHESHSQ